MFIKDLRIDDTRVNIGFVVLTFVIASLLVLISRVSLRELGLELDAGVVTGSHWQNLPLDYLASDLSHALLHLHSQPPFWNFILGVISKSCSAKIECVLIVGHIFNIIMTLAASFILLRTLLLIGLSARLCAVLAILYTILPSVVFYEHYLFYPHFTSTLFLAQIYFMLLFVKTKNSFYSLYAFISAALLSLTWSLFHPFYVFVIFITLWIAVGNLVFSRFVFISAMISAIIAFSPSIKNKYLFDINSNGSWIGFNLSQVAPSLSSELSEKCNFMTYIRIGANYYDAPLATRDRLDRKDFSSMKLNDPALISISKECAVASFRNIITNPVSYVRGRLGAASESFSLPSYRYMFSPKNWEKIDPLPKEISFRHADGSLNVFASIYRLFSLFFYVVTIVCAGWIVTFSSYETRQKIVVLFIPVLVFILLSHGFNGGEQNRMRHTIELPIWLLAYLSARAIVNRFRKVLVLGHLEKSTSAA